jgi:hypothetical protein
MRVLHVFANVVDELVKAWEVHLGSERRLRMLRRLCIAATPIAIVAGLVAVWLPIGYVLFFALALPLFVGHPVVRQIVYVLLAKACGVLRLANVAGWAPHAPTVEAGLALAAERLVEWSRSLGAVLVKQRVAGDRKPGFFGRVVIHALSLLAVGGDAAAGGGRGNGAGETIADAAALGAGAVAEGGTIDDIVRANRQQKWLSVVEWHIWNRKAFTIIGGSWSALDGSDRLKNLASPPLGWKFVGLWSKSAWEYTSEEAQAKVAKAEDDAADAGERGERDGRWHDRMHKNDTYRRRLWKRRIVVDCARCRESLAAHVAERERAQRQLARQLGDDVATPGREARRAPSLLAAAAAPYGGAAAAAADDAVFEEDGFDVLVGEEEGGGEVSGASRLEHIAAGVARRVGLFDSVLLDVDAEGALSVAPANVGKFASQTLSLRLSVGIPSAEHWHFSAGVGAAVSRHSAVAYVVRAARAPIHTCSRFSLLVRRGARA